MAEEKIYTIPLRREFLKVPKYKRSKKAMTSLKEFLRKHLKKEIKIGKYLSEEIFKKGFKNPPSRVKVRIEGDTAELIDAPREEKKEEKKGKIESLKEKVIGKKEEKVPEKKVEKVKEKVEEKEHEHRKQEKVIPTEKTGQLRKD